MLTLASLAFFGFGTIALLTDRLSLLGLPIVSLCFWSLATPLGLAAALAVARNRGSS